MTWIRLTHIIQLWAEETGKDEASIAGRLSQQILQCDAEVGKNQVQVRGTFSEIKPSLASKNELADFFMKGARLVGGTSPNNVYLNSSWLSELVHTVGGIAPSFLSEAPEQRGERLLQRYEDICKNAGEHGALTKLAKEEGIKRQTLTALIDRAFKKRELRG